MRDTTLSVAEAAFILNVPEKDVAQTLQARPNPPISPVLPNGAGYSARGLLAWLKAGSARTLAYERLHLLAEYTTLKEARRILGLAAHHAKKALKSPEVVKIRRGKRLFYQRESLIALRKRLDERKSELKDALGIREALAYLGIHYSTLYSWRKEMPELMPEADPETGLLRYKKADLDELKRRAISPKFRLGEAIKEACAYLGISRSSFYSWRKAMPELMPEADPETGLKHFNKETLDKLRGKITAMRYRGGKT